MKIKDILFLFLAEEFLKGGSTKPTSKESETFEQAAISSVSGAGDACSSTAQNAEQSHVEHSPSKRKLADTEAASPSKKAKE